MDISQLTYGFADQLTPALSLATANRHLGWALTLTALLLFILKSLPSLPRFTIAAAVFVGCVVPTQWSLAHALGLAYQTPSLVTQGVALLYLLELWQRRGAASLHDTSRDVRWPTSILLIAITAGWALLLDTFAVLPVQLYAMGYGPGVPLLGLMMAVILWGMSRWRANPRQNPRTGALAVVLLATVAIFTLTRLPSGNAWDAMLDPWLWIAAHVTLIGRGILRIARRSRPTQL